MKRVIAVLAPVLVVAAGVYATGGPVPPSPPDPVNSTAVTIGNEIDVSQVQNVSVDSGNASADSDSVSISGASVSTSSVSNYETRTPPLTVFPPYLPYWNHGGWGTIKAYFPNGPSDDNQVYEQTFDPDNADDMKMLRGVLGSLAHDGPLEFVGGILNGVGAVLCGGPDNFHHGRGFEIGNSLIRCRRPRGKPLLVFIDSNVDTEVLREAGYAYVGKVSLEGKVERNWDQVYDAAIAEVLPWDVDILLVSGGMRGVTVGSNLSFPGAAGGYSQANYSVSLFGAVSSGITEGKGKALVSAVGYRFWPEAARKRRIPQSFYNRIQASYKPAPQPSPSDAGRPRQESVQPAAPGTPAAERAITIPPPQRKTEYYGVEVSRELLSMAGF